MLQPLPLRPGDPVAVVAPASPPHDLDPYRRGLSRLRSVYDVRQAWAPGTQRGYLAAPDAARARSLNDAIRDPAIRAIICVRGGYGSIRLLNRIDWGLARTHPTLLVGYSDVTILHMAFHARVGWTGLSAPVVTEWAEAGDDTLRPFQMLAEGGTPTLGDGALRPMCTGTAEGPLLGGNLSVLTRLVGTPFAPDFHRSILVLEEVAEAPYRVDRMLSHLEHAGILDAVAGVVLGHFSTGDLDPNTPTLSLEEVFRDYFGDRPYPVATDLPYGHLLPRCSLPLGVPTRLSITADAAQLRPLLPAVHP